MNVASTPAPLCWSESSSSPARAVAGRGALYLAHSVLTVGITIVYAMGTMSPSSSVLGFSLGS